jgi:glycosyltransferase involved in cell wall biosynthesis
MSTETSINNPFDIRKDQRRIDADGSSLPVLLMARELNFGGIERDVSKFARHLGSYGIAPHVACFNPGGIRWREIEAAGIPVLHVPVTSFKSRSAIDGAKLVKKYVRDHNIRIIHSFDDGSNIFGTVVGKMIGIPVLASLLGARKLSSLKNRIMTVLLVDRLATGTFVNCEALATELVETWHVPRNGIRVCYNGFEIGQFNPENRRRPPQLADASVVIGTVALLRPEKNLGLLIDAFAKVHQREPNARLLIVGSGPLKQELEKRVQELQIAPFCVFEAATTMPATWMRAIDVFVLPSRSEAFSNALLEAMACGCCPVGSRVGGMPELIRHGEHGFLFDPGSSDELADQLTKLALNPDLRAEMAGKAVRFAFDNLTIEIASQKLASLYRGLLQERELGR